MTTDIRETLHDIGASVAPPVLDGLAFEGRVRRARTRRRLGQAAVATAAVAAVGVTAWLVSPGGSSQPDLADDPGRDDVPTRSSKVLAYAQQDTLFLSPPDDPEHGIDTGLPVEEVIARVPDGVVYVDPDSHLKRVDVHVDGTVGEPVDLVGPDPIQWADVDATGTRLWFVDLHNRLHQRELGSSADASRTTLTPSTTVLAVGVDSWVDRDGAGKLRLHTPDGEHELDVEGAAGAAQIGGSVVAVQGELSAELFTASDGVSFQGTGSGLDVLSPDGAWVASAPDDEAFDQGVRGLALTEVHGTIHPQQTFTDPGRVLDIWWADADRYFLVVEHADEEGPTRRVWECVVMVVCQPRLEDVSGTLQLPRD